MSDTNHISAEGWAFWSSWTAAQQIVASAIDRRLQRECGISKAEFSVLMTLTRAPGHTLPIAALIEALGWEKSRLSHQLTRMEKRELVRAMSGAGGRRTAITLTQTGQSTIEHAIGVHGQSVRQYFLDTLTAEQEAAIRGWCAAIQGSSSLLEGG